MLFLILSNSAYGLVHHIRRAMARVNARPAVVVMTDGVRLGQVYSALGIGASAIVDMDCSGEDLAGVVWLVLEGKRYISPEVTKFLVDDIAMTLERQDLDVPALSELSHREIEVIHMLCEGLDLAAIAESLKLNPKDVEEHRSSIYRKCNVGSIVSLMRFAVQNGLVTV
jgi:DNA-binding NarL/FixJ family response regulator